MSEPMTDDLQRAFDDLVGQPRPRADLAARARVRGTTLRRQRLAGGLAAVAATGALCVPGLALVRDQAHGGAAGAPVAGQPTAPDPAAASKAKAADIAAAEQAKAKAKAGGNVDKAQASAAGGAAKGDGSAGTGPTKQTAIKPGVLTATDNARLETAKALLGSTFTLASTDIAVDATTGAQIGAAVTFASATGGKLGIEWSTGEHSTNAATATIGPKEGSIGPAVLGAVLIQGATEWDLKVVQGPVGSTPFLATATAASAFLTQLATAP